MGLEGPAAPAAGQVLHKTNLPWTTKKPASIGVTWGCHMQVLLISLILEELGIGSRDGGAFYSLCVLTQSGAL